jgi:hypothetical protein
VDRDKYRREHSHCKVRTFSGVDGFEDDRLGRLYWKLREHGRGVRSVGKHVDRDKYRREHPFCKERTLGGLDGLKNGSLGRILRDKYGRSL